METLEPGKRWKTVGICTDITSKKLLEEALHEEQSRARLVADALPQMVWTMSAEDGIDFVNQRWIDYTGLGLEETLLWESSPVVHPDDLTRLVLAWNAAISTDVLLKMESRYRRNSDDAYRWHLVCSLPLHDDQEHITMWVGTVTDIHDRKTGEMERYRLAAIVDSSQDAIISKTLEGIILTWNPAAETIFGYKAEEVIGRHKTLLFPPERLSEEDDILARLRCGERLEPLESVRVRKDGKPIDVSLTISPVRNAQGEIIAASTIARDITEQKKQQRDLVAMNARMERSMQETHHRVKNNLQILAALLDMLMLDYEEALPITEVKRLSLQVMTLAGIHDILTSNAISLEETETLISAKRVFGNLLALLELSAQQYHLDYEIEDLKLNIRQATSLALVTNELVNNGMKHGHQRVCVTLRQVDQTAQLVVEDDGPGLPEGFNPLAAASTGLSLVTTLTQHDLSGTLVFENGTHGGARVCVTIPLCDQTALIERS